MLRLGSIALWIAAFAAVAGGVAALGYRARLLPLGASFLTLGAGLVAALAATALSVMALVLALARTPRPEGIVVRPAIALAASVVILSIPAGGFLLNRAGSVPPIHDITTDVQDPPAFADVLPLRGDGANSVEYGGPAVAAQQQRAYPDITPLRLRESPDDVFDRALAAVQALGWALAGSNRAQGRIEATDTTFWFGFKDDVVIRVRSEEGGSRVDVRSVSRVGTGDVGTNARRIRRFLRTMEHR